ncbi:MAG: chorismate mutase [Candidatus Acidiferrales bacterium]|jgi:chorismate mutase-like protein
MKTIDDWRRRIDEIDLRLVELLNERSQCALEIGHLKRASGVAIYQPERERMVLDAVEQASRGPLSPAAIRRLWERILDEARSVERAVVQEAADEPHSAAPDAAPKQSKAQHKQ